MVKLKLLLCLFGVTTLRASEGYFNESSLESRATKSYLPLGLRLPSYTVYIPYQGSADNIMLSADKYNTHYTTFALCKASAARNGAHFWFYQNGQCFLGTLMGPVCRYMHAKQQLIYILKNFLTSGTKYDKPFPSPGRTNELMNGERHLAFRVMTPTITKIPGFTKYIGHSWKKSDQRGKIFLLSDGGGFVATDDEILLDPACFTNSLCGVPFVTTSTVAFAKPNFHLTQICNRILSVTNTPSLNVFSHAGVGCQPFPSASPTPKCEVYVTSCHKMRVTVTMVNFKTTTACGGYTLEFLVIHRDGTTYNIDVCKKNAWKWFEFTGGKMKITLSGRSLTRYDRTKFCSR